jgi:hypothetical protein
MFKRCVFLHCFCNGKISSLGIDIRANWLELAQILRGGGCTFVQKSLGLGALSQSFSKQHLTQIKEGST